MVRAVAAPLPAHDAHDVCVGPLILSDTQEDALEAVQMRLPRRLSRGWAAGRPDKAVHTGQVAATCRAHRIGDRAIADVSKMGARDIMRKLSLRS